MWENKLGNKNYFYGWFGTLSRSLEMYFFEVVKNLGHFSLFVEATINIIESEKTEVPLWVGQSHQRQLHSTM